MKSTYHSNKSNLDKTRDLSLILVFIFQSFLTINMDQSRFLISPWLKVNNGCYTFTNELLDNYIFLT